MKVRVTNLKGPWPTGAKVGDVVAFDGEAMPAWAVGKCAPAPDDANEAFRYEPKVAMGGGSDRAHQEREAAIQDAFNDLRAERDQALQQLESVQAALSAALDREAGLQHQLDVALVAAVAAPVAKTRADLSAEAEKLGIKVDGRWSDERLAEEIAKAGKK